MLGDGTIGRGVESRQDMSVSLRQRRFQVGLAVQLISR